MKITNIDIIPIYPRLAQRFHDEPVENRGINQLTVFRVETDNGLVGYGDCRTTWEGPQERSSVEPLIGRDPFDFINNNLIIGLGGALYDVMGKYLEVPAYKLMGQKVRDGVTVAAWARPSAPEVFCDEIVRVVSQGYKIFKVHTSEYHDVLEQTRLAEKIAPEGFKLHYDFHSNRSIGAVLPIIKELERRHPIVGWIEDPLLRQDIDGWRTLRQRTSIPLIMHAAHLGSVQEVVHGVADLYMLGESGGIGGTLSRGFGLSALNIQTIMQLTGGTLTKALALHMSSVLPSATGHAVIGDDLYEDDIVTDRIPVIEGFSQVPEGPGLGVDVDEDTLKRLAANTPMHIPRYVGILDLPNGRRFYTPSFPEVSRLTGGEEGSFRGIRSEIWEEDGTTEFEQIYERVQKEGPFLLEA